MKVATSLLKMCKRMSSPSIQAFPAKRQQWEFAGNRFGCGMNLKIRFWMRPDRASSGANYS
jgi:hypothetical protein